jgi:HD-GYP domain-containing protein (c-di-GMP phosphodiesterase class II)
MSLTEGFYHSCRVYDDATKTIKDLYNNISPNKKINLTAINTLADEIINSIIRNEYVLSILTSIRDKDTYHWEHAINTAILISGISLYLGMKKETVVQIAIGVLLHDTGAAKIPIAI